MYPWTCKGQLFEGSVEGACVCRLLAESQRWEERQSGLGRLEAGGWGLEAGLLLDISEIGGN